MCFPASIFGIVRKGINNPTISKVPLLEPRNLPLLFCPWWADEMGGPPDYSDWCHLFPFIANSSLLPIPRDWKVFAAVSFPLKGSPRCLYEHNFSGNRGGFSKNSSLGIPTLAAGTIYFQTQRSFFYIRGNESSMQCCGAETFCFHSGSGSDTDFQEVLAPAPAPAPTLAL